MHKIILSSDKYNVKKNRSTNFDKNKRFQWFQLFRQETLEDLQRFAIDQVTKNKKIEQYISEKSGKELIQIMGSHALFKDKEELKKNIGFRYKGLFIRKLSRYNI